MDNSDKTVESDFEIISNEEEEGKMEMETLVSSLARTEITSEETKKAATSLFSSIPSTSMQNDDFNWKAFPKRMFTYLLEEGNQSDFELIVGTGYKEERIPTHRLILMAASPILEIILKDEPHRKELDFPMTEPNVFHQLLKFIYTGMWDKEFRTAVPLMCLADLLKIGDLPKECAEVLKNGLSKSNSLKYINFPELPEFEGLALAEACRHGSEILNQEEFLNLNESTIQKIISNDGLVVTSELLVFEALMRWSAAECKRQKMDDNTTNRRSVLENLIPHIRFPLMNKCEFSMKVYPTKILTTDEVVSILVTHDIPYNLLSQIPGDYFLNRPRKYDADIGGIILYRLPNVGTSPLYPNSTTWHRISFQVDSPIWMTSVGINRVKADMYRGNEIKKTEFTVEVTLETSSVQMVTFKTETVRVADLVAHHRQIKFDQRIRLQPKQWYTLSTRTIGNYYGMNFFSEVSKVKIYENEGRKSVGIEFQGAGHYKTSNPATNATSGQMASLGFQFE